MHRAGVHAQGAAHRGGDAGQALGSGQAGGDAVVDQLGQVGRGAGRHAAPVALPAVADEVEVAAETHHRLGQALVADQQVGALAQPARAAGDRLGQVAAVIEDGDGRRPADAEGGQPGQALGRHPVA